MLQNIKSYIRRHMAMLRIVVASLASYFGMQMTQVTVLANANKGKGEDGNFSDYVDTNKGGNGFLGIANYLDTFVPQAQGIGAVLLVIFCIICGIKLGASAVSDNPRARSSALWGVFFIILGGVMIIHARQIVGMSVGIKA